MNDEKFFNVILNVLSRNLNINMFYYDRNYLYRRITSRMSQIGINSFYEYYKYLIRNENEIEMLINHIAINYTEFFRDREVFEYIYNEVFPEIFKRKRIYILSAGCSTGQEAYSISILIHEFLREKIKEYDVKIIAGDIDKDALKYASEGIYRKDEVRNIDDEILRKYFVNLNDKYKVKDEIKSIVEFIYMDLTSENKFFEFFDMILCRNVIIYIDQRFKKKIFENLYKMLKKNGYLILGKSESMPLNLREKFDVVSLENKIYKKR